MKLHIKRHLASVLAGCLVLGSMTVMGQVVQDGNKLTISQTTGAVKNNEVNIAIYYEGKSASDLVEGNMTANLGALAYFGSVQTDADGGYTLDVMFKADAPGGNYTIIQSGTAANEAPVIFAYIDTDEWILKAANEADGYSELKAVIESNKDYLGLDTTNTSDQAYNSMSGSYTTIAELKADFEAMKSAYPVTSVTPPPIISGGGGNSGSSGGILSGGGTIYDNGTANNSVGTGGANNPEELNRYVFDDIENIEWAREAICALAEIGVLSGKENRLFYPEDLVTREEFVKMIVAAFGIDAESPNCSLKDVNKNEWYYPYVAKAFASGVVKGNGTNFGIGKNITRQDLAVMAYNAAKTAGAVFGDVDGSFLFDDDETIADYAGEAVYCLQNEGVINGVDLRNFAPGENATRAQAAKIVYQLLEMMD